MVYSGGAIGDAFPRPIEETGVRGCRLWFCGCTLRSGLDCATSNGYNLSVSVPPGLVFLLSCPYCPGKLLLRRCNANGFGGLFGISNGIINPPGR